ncbi:MAG: cardiolipin synthase [Gammaproteobacteria bacterium]|nr:cardiolipin synthase [Gammaproteobacteria bacterium]
MPYYYLVSLLLFLLAVYSAIHALLHKTDSRAAFGWITISLLLPLFGPILYFLFGINRVHERAKKLDYPPLKFDSYTQNLQSEIPDSLINIQHISYQLTKLPLVAGNTIEVLFSGGQTYPAMLESIRAAKKYIYLSTYIFKVDEIGAKFVQALIEANDRGIDVYVLIDGIGEHYSRIKARRILSKQGVKVDRFLPPKLFPFNMNVNLRNHRKILVVDDEVCFVGGMNICNEYMLEVSPMKDIHFKIKGELTYQLKALFESDWDFANGGIDKNQNKPFFTSNNLTWCRVISDGPGENLGHLSLVIFSAINAATKSICIMTPYFLPSKELLHALQVAALRNVDVSVVLPLKNNLNFVNWASRHMLSQLITSGVTIYYQPPPFDHSKIFVVDEFYSLIGSANIDPRSLRLNYEVAVEIYDAPVAFKLTQNLNSIIKVSRRVALDELERRPLMIKIRDGIAWLFSPYL